MRILTIVTKLTPGGTERSAQNCSIAYGRHGHEVAVLAYDGGGPRAEIINAAGIPTFVGGSGGEETDRAVAEAAAWGPEVIHVHRTGHSNPRSAGILRRLKREVPGRLPVVETNHFARVDRSPDRSLIDVHMLLSCWCMWKWQSWAGGLRPAPLGVVMPHMVNSDSFYPAGEEARASFRAEHGIPEDAMVYGRVGQPLVSKWSSSAFDAFREVAAASPNAWLLIVGVPEKYRAKVRGWPESLRRSVVDIPFLHGDEALRGCYSAMDVFLHSATIGESFGLVLAEAMLCNLPIVALSTPLRDNSQLEVVGHERGGLIAASKAGLVEAMNRLAGDREERARLAEQGRQWCLHEYSTDRIAQRMLRLMEITRQAETPEQLRAALERDEEFITRVERAEIGQLLSRTLGQTGPMVRLLMDLGHVPWLHRALVRGKGLARRLRGGS